MTRSYWAAVSLPPISRRPGISRETTGGEGGALEIGGKWLLAGLLLVGGKR